MRHRLVLVLVALALALAGWAVAANQEALTRTLIWKAPDRCEPGVMPLGQKNGVDIFVPIIYCRKVV